MLIIFSAYVIAGTEKNIDCIIEKKLKKEHKTKLKHLLIAMRKYIIRIFIFILIPLNTIIKNFL